MFTFDAFEPGRIYGSHPFVFDRAVLDDWLAVHPGDDGGGLMPPGMTSVVQIRAYMAVIAPRPPGNIHGAQRTELVRLPALDTALATSVGCLDKEVRKGRRLVRLATETRDDAGVLMFRGLMTSLVAR